MLLQFYCFWFSFFSFKDCVLKVLDNSLLNIEIAFEWFLLLTNFDPEMEIKTLSKIDMGVVARGIEDVVSKSVLPESRLLVSEDF